MQKQNSYINMTVAGKKMESYPLFSELKLTM